MYCVHASLKKMLQSALVLQTVTLKNVCWVSGSRCLLHSEEPLILLLFFCLLDVCYCSKEICYNCFSDLWLCLTCYRVICKLLASKSESIRVQALKVLGYFLKHLGHKSVLLAELSWYISFVWFSAALKWGSTWYFPIILLSFTTKHPPKCCISGGRWSCATHSVGLSVWKDTAVKAATVQSPLNLRKTVCLCVHQDNALVIMSRRNNPFDSVHWQGGGTLMSSSECWGIYSSHVTAAPLAAWHESRLP